MFSFTMHFIKPELNFHDEENELQFSLLYVHFLINQGKFNIPIKNNLPSFKKKVHNKTHNN